ncbi:MAG: archaeosortase/exosortase family protein [Actinobacteria bacterium]|nr:archaeosortase/exosortase family protein [Actinomycetota bacterium]
MKTILIILIITSYIAIIVFLRKQKAWLTYYLFGALGLTLVLVFGMRLSGLELYWEKIHLYQAVLFSNFLGIKARTLGISTFLVPDKTGWILLQIGIECSAILESSVLIGLISFYPSFETEKKIKLILTGLIITVLANIIRIQIIINIVHYFGRDAIFTAHAIIGRLFFFMCIAILYWYILTQPTLNKIHKTINEAGKQKKCHTRESGYPVFYLSGFPFARE